MQRGTSSQPELAMGENERPGRRLIDYFAVCGLGTEKQCLESRSRLHVLLPSVADQIGDWSSHVASLLDRFPPHDHPSCELPRMLPSVVLPQGVRCYTRGESRDVPESMPTLYTAILTDTLGAPTYVAALKFRDWIGPFLAKIHGLPHHSFADKCLCIVSRMPFLDDFSRILQQLHCLCFLPNGCPRSVWEMAAEITSIPLPDPGTTLISTFQGQLFPFRLPEPSCPRPYHVSFLLLVENLSIDAILAVFTAALLEHKILLTSVNTALLTPSAESLAALLFPLKWTGVFVPVLPLDALECLEAPVPFIYGLPTENLDLHTKELDGVLVVDMDTSSVTWTFSGEDHNSTGPPAASWIPNGGSTGYSQVPRLPGKVSRQLKKALAHLIKPHTAASSAIAHSLSWEDQALRDLCQGLEGSRWGPKHDDVFHVAFIRAMAAMLRGYKDYLHASGGGEEGKPTLHHSSLSDAFDTKGFLKHKEETMELSTDPAAAAFMEALTGTHAWMAFLAEESSSQQGRGRDSRAAEGWESTPADRPECAKTSFFQQALHANSLQEILSSYPRHRHSNATATFLTPLVAADPVFHRPAIAPSKSSCEGQSEAGSVAEGREAGTPTRQSCPPEGTCGGGQAACTPPPQRIVYDQFPESPASLVAAARAKEAAQKLHRQSAHAREERQAEEERVRLDMLARLCHHLSRLSADPSDADAAQEVLRVLGLFELRGVGAQYFVPCIEEWFRDLASFPRQVSASHRASEAPRASPSLLQGPGSHQGTGESLGLLHRSSVPSPKGSQDSAHPATVALGTCVQLLAAALGLAHRQRDFASAAALVDMASQVLVPVVPGQGEAKRLLVGQLRGLDIWHGVELWAALLHIKSKKGGADCASAALHLDRNEAPPQKQQGPSIQQQLQQQAPAGNQKQVQGQQKQQKQNPLAPKQPAAASKQVQETKAQEKGKQALMKGKEKENQEKQKQQLQAQKSGLQKGQKGPAQEQQTQEMQAQEVQTQEQQAQEGQLQAQERVCISPSLVQSLVQVMSHVGLEDTEMSIILDTLAAGLPLKMQILLRDQFAEMQVLVRPTATHASTFLSFLRRQSKAEGGSGGGGEGGGSRNKGGVYSDKLSTKGMDSDRSATEQSGTGGPVSSASLRWMQAVAGVGSSVRQTH